MVAESIMICFDNSDYRGNNDNFPTRLIAQIDAINLFCMTNLRSNPKNNFGLMTISNTVELLTPLTSDASLIYSKMHSVLPNGEVNLATGIRIAHLLLKQSEGKNHKMRIVVFIGTPIRNVEADFVNLTQSLKEEKVNVDIVSFGDLENNTEVLTTFINTLNENHGTGSHLVSVPRGSGLYNALLSSPIIQGEDGMGGVGFEFFVDPYEDKELDIALRVSMEEHMQRQEKEQRLALFESNAPGNAEDNADSAGTTGEQSAGSATAGVGGDEQMIDFANMSEEEQFAFAMQMSMEDAADETASKQVKHTKTEETMPTDLFDEYLEVIGDSAFLQSMLQNIPGVDPQSDTVRDVLDSLRMDKEKETEQTDDESDKN